MPEGKRDGKKIARCTISKRKDTQLKLFPLTHSSPSITWSKQYVCRCMQCGPTTHRSLEMQCHEGDVGNCLHNSVRTMEYACMFEKAEKSAVLNCLSTCQRDPRNSDIRSFSSVSENPGLQPTFCHLVKGDDHGYSISTHHTFHSTNNWRFIQ